MLEMQAVIGRIQLGRMPAWSEARRANAGRVLGACAAQPWLRVPSVPEDVVHAAYRAYAFVEPERLPEGWSRDRVVEAIVAAGVPCYQGSCSEIYREAAFEGTGFRPPEPLPVARELGENSLMFLVHPTLTDEEIERTVAAIEAVGRADSSASVPAPPEGTPRRPRVGLPYGWEAASGRSRRRRGSTRNVTAAR